VTEPLPEATDPRSAPAPASARHTRPAHDVLAWLTGRGSPLLVGWSVALVGALLLTGCAGQDQTGPPAARVSSWVTGAGGGAAVGTLSVDSRNVDLALARKDPAAAIRTVCALLTTDAETAIGNLPTPDSQLTTDLNRAYEDAAAAGDACFKGASGTASLLRQSSVERARLMPLLRTAVDRIVAVTGHTPSTSTTRPAGHSDPFGN
jgi:hypothetical protein